MSPDRQRKRRSMLGTAAYILVPGERRKKAAGHFSRAAIEAAKGVRALSLPGGSGPDTGDAGSPGESSGRKDRQSIEIE